MLRRYGEDAARALFEQEEAARLAAKERKAKNLAKAVHVSETWNEVQKAEDKVVRRLVSYDECLQAMPALCAACAKTYHEAWTQSTQMHAFDKLTEALDAISRHTLGVVEAVVAWRKELVAEAARAAEAAKTASSGVRSGTSSRLPSRQQQRGGKRGGRGPSPTPDVAKAAAKAKKKRDQGGGSDDDSDEDNHDPIDDVDDEDPSVRPFLWRGRNVLARIPAALDFLHDCAELREWYGAGFALLRNPFQIPVALDARPRTPRKATTTIILDGKEVEQEQPRLRARRDRDEKKFHVARQLMKSGARWWPGRGIEEGMWIRVRRAEKVLSAEARRVARQRGVFGENLVAALAPGGKLKQPVVGLLEESPVKKK